MPDASTPGRRRSPSSDNDESNRNMQAHHQKPSLPISARGRPRPGRPPSDARVTRIVIDTTTVRANPAARRTVRDAHRPRVRRARSERSAQRAHHRHRGGGARANGKVEYIASFFIVKPVDMRSRAALLWHDVPNRGGDVALPTDSARAQRHRHLAAAGRATTPAPPPCRRTRLRSLVAGARPVHQRMGEDAGAERRDRPDPRAHRQPQRLERARRST